MRCPNRHITYVEHDGRDVVWSPAVVRGVDQSRGRGVWAPKVEEQFFDAPIIHHAVEAVAAKQVPVTGR